MYSIYADGVCIYNDVFSLDDMKVVNPKLTLEDSAAGSLELTLPHTNKAYDTIIRMVTEISVKKHGEEIWSGRVLSESKDFWNNRVLYTAKFVLGYGYVFPGNQDEAEVEWTIDRATIASLPSQSNVLAANGTPQIPTWDDYDVTQLTIGGDRFGTDAGNYTATFTPTANYKWWDGSTEAKEVTWTITSVIVSIPVQSGSLTYTGAPQTPEWDNFDQENSSVSVTPQTNAGTHSATFTLLTGMWSDGTTGKKTVNWTIGRASTIASSRKKIAPTTRSIPCPGQRHRRKITPRFPSSACGLMEPMKLLQRSAAYADTPERRSGIWMIFISIC